MPLRDAQIRAVNILSFLTAHSMIKEVNGDILLSGAQIIAHGVAPNDHFDSGLALSLREEFPGMYKDFRQYCHQAHPKAGEIWRWQGEERQIVNLLTQDPSDNKGHGGHPGRASLSNVTHALHELKKLISREKLRSVAITRLATGVGGLDWEEVKPLIYSQLNDVDAAVFVYTSYVKNQIARETL